MSVEKLLDYLKPKTFGKFHFVAVVIWILIGVIFLAVFADMENNEPWSDFRCAGAKTENIDLVRGKCYEKYEKQYNKYAFPVYGFVIVNFVPIIFVCVIYSQIVRPTVNRLSRSIRNGDPERQSHDQGNALSTGNKLFKAYCYQLLLRLYLGVFFIILQTRRLYPLKFPSKFHCNLTDGTTQPWNSSDNAQNSTLHDCHNLRAVKKTLWINAVLVVNGILVVGILIEIVYLFLRACRQRYFMQNSKFQTSHLNPRKEAQQQESTENILLSRSKREQRLKTPLQEFIQETKEMIINDTYQPPQLQSLFSSPPDKGDPPKHLTLDQIYTSLFILPGMANEHMSLPMTDKGDPPKHLTLDQIFILPGMANEHMSLPMTDFPEDRRKNLETYTRLFEKNERPREPEDILNRENKNVLIVGCPGIGKTLWCTKILRDWASDKIFHNTPDNKIHFDAAFFVEYRIFNTETDLSLKELLTRSTYSPSDQLNEEVWNYILENPQRVLLIFDGVKLNSKISTEANKPQFINSVDKKMPIFALYAKLATGKLLKGAAVLTTTRPTALSCIESIPFDKVFEIFGFPSEQVKEYVTKFAEEDEEAVNTVRRHITSNIVILSLCHIPASCFIICSRLFKMVKLFGSESLNIPTRFTDIYKKAVKIFYLRHNEEFRNKHFTRENFESNDFPPKEEKKFEKLEKMAFEGIKEGRLVFGGNEVRGMEESALFHRLLDRETAPLKRERQFCFIHLTMQEFFAARHLANMNETELRNFVSMNIEDGKWQLVFQFLAGLMNEKENLPSEIITDLLPVETEEKESEFYNEEWTEDMEPRKVTCWPTEDKKHLAVTLFKCINESSEMEEIVQRKLQQINFNFVNFNACQLTPVDCASVVTVIKNVQQISHLHLAGNNIGPLGCFEICKLLKCSKSQLSWLRLGGNQFTAETAEY